MDPSITFLLGIGVGVLATCVVHVVLIWQGIREMDAHGDPLQPSESTDLPPHHREDTR